MAITIVYICAKIPEPASFNRLEMTGIKNSLTDCNKIQYKLSHRTVSMFSPNSDWKEVPYSFIFVLATLTLFKKDNLQE